MIGLGKCIMIFIMIPKKEILALCDVKKNPCHIKKKSLPMRSNPMPRHGRGIAAINMK
jgi:hypothetical protein